MNIVDLLVGWAKGKALNEAPNGYKPPGWTRSIRNSGRATVSIPPLSDELHMKVERAMFDLRDRKPECYSAVVMFYLLHHRDQDIAASMNCSKGKARTLRLNAENWLDARVL